MKHPLTRVHIGAVPPEGMVVDGQIAAGELDIENEDRISFPDLVDYRFELSVVSGGLLARGEASTRSRCRCDRCLVYFDFSVKLVELCYFVPVKEDETVDLTEPIRQDILLLFPQRLVCDADCRGLCGKCGQNLNVRLCECEEREETESVWRELDKLDLT